jgi:alpha-L-fucosidase
MTSEPTADGAVSFDWEQLARPTPSWWSDAKLGIFIHWGAFSVPAWAEPTGELGTVDDSEWFRHNPYAEWYWNTIRLADSPARRHHRQVYSDAPYDDFLDSWTVGEFDPDAWVRLFARAGGRYVVPTTKHHDGIALWDAPGTGRRNTVLRGPRRDLVGELERAVRAAGLRFGVYYSGGLDWSVSNFEPIDSHTALRQRRPTDAAYASYAYSHVRDLIDRYNPAILWNDIEWPDAGKHGLDHGLGELFSYYYSRVPDGLVNDRWGDTHADYRTSEYQAHLDSESASSWENCRGIGLSFGYNQVEDETHLLNGRQLARHLVDVVSRGGNLLLNVGPSASGTIPPGQARALEELGDWVTAEGAAIFGSRSLSTAAGAPSEDPWVRWTTKDGRAWALVDQPGPVILRAGADRIDYSSAALVDGTALESGSVDGGVRVEVPMGVSDLPVAISFRLR